MIDRVAATECLSKADWHLTEAQRCMARPAAAIVELGLADAAMQTMDKLKAVRLETQMLRDSFVTQGIGQ